MKRTPACQRGLRPVSGFSLLEVLMATSILVGCLIVLSELAAIGRQHAEDAHQLTTAQTLCETKLNEILAGVQPAEPLEEQPLEGLPGWQYSVETQPLKQLGLVKLQVTVKEQLRNRRTREFSLVQWMREPQSGRRPEISPPPPLGGPGGGFP